jgi:hypothetical protein
LSRLGLGQETIDVKGYLHGVQNFCRATPRDTVRHSATQCDTVRIDAIFGRSTPALQKFTILQILQILQIYNTTNRLVRFENILFSTLWKRSITSTSAFLVVPKWKGHRFDSRFRRGVVSNVHRYFLVYHFILPCM